MSGPELITRGPEAGGNAAIAAAAGNPNAVTVNRPDGTDQTAAVQAAIDALPASGGTIVISNGTKFSLRDLVFPSGASRTYLEYRVDDEQEQNGPAGTGLATNERVIFAACANADGIVNEPLRATAAFHPGIGVDVRKDVAGQDGSLGGGQSRTNPARASFNIWDERLSQWATLYTRYNTSSVFSGVSQFVYRNVWAISGIGTSSFASVPAVGTVITGTTSGAKGLYLSGTSNAMVLLWLTGAFSVGETVSDNNETTTDTISSRTYSATPTHALAQDFNTGNWGLSVPPGEASAPFTVGGRIAVAQSRSMGQHLPTTYTDPGYQWIDDSTAGTLTGSEVIRESTGGKLVRTKLGETTARAHVDAVTCHGNVYYNAAYNSSRCFNIGSVSKLQTGEWQVNFATAFDFDDYTVIVGSQNPTDHGFVFTRYAGYMILRCVETGTSTLKDMTGGFLNFAVFGNGPA